MDDAQQPPHQTGQHIFLHTDNSQHFPYQVNNAQRTFVQQPHFQMGVYPPNIQPPQEHHVPEIIPGFAPRNNNFVQGTDVENLGTFLLKKDLVPQRMTKFDDDPTSFMVWKGTFKSVVADIKANDIEQLDLLLRW